MEKKSIYVEEIGSLPEDVIVELLLQMPIKSLLTLKCVSKSWYSFIGSDNFIKIHLQNSTQNTAFSNHRIAILHDYNLISLPVASLLNHNSDDYPLNAISPPADDIPFMPELVVGCCNGLFCLLGITRCFFLWNPSTRISKKLPDHDFLRQYFMIAFGFGWEEVSDEYKLVVLFGREEDDGVAYRTLVYGSKKNSYKTLDHDKHLNCPWDLENEEGIKEGQFVRGKLHWLTSEEIVSWDLKSEMFGVIETPFSFMEYDDYEQKLGTLGGYLCFICHNMHAEIVVWVMKEYGVKQSWEKHVNISLSHVRRFMQPPFLAPFIRGSGNGEILLLSASTFMVLYRENNPQFFRHEWFIAGGHVYVESLVMPKYDGHHNFFDQSI